MRRFLETVVWCSEKAAGLARACRKEKDLFQLLVEEKIGDQKNAAYSQDFKTLADVLIQETVRHDLGRHYPELKDNIHGEETSEFTNTLGEKIKVQICDTKEETSALLCRVLDGRKVAADLLAKEVHSSVPPWNNQSEAINEKCCKNAVEDLVNVPDEEGIEFRADDLAIWIDPIDATNNYIRGKDSEKICSDVIQSRGLAVVTVLIGVYNRNTGAPIAGVINQPFVYLDDDKKSWKGKIHWGVTMEDGRRFFSSHLLKPESDLSESNKSSGNLDAKNKNTKRAVSSLTESALLVDILRNEGYDVVEAAGAGYKILAVIQGWVDIYITAKDSTYKWDTCAGQAILNSLGGGITDLRTGKQTIYHLPLQEQKGIDQWSNVGGIVAFRTQDDLNRVQGLVQKFLTTQQQHQKFASQNSTCEDDN